MQSSRRPNTSYAAFPALLRGRLHIVQLEPPFTLQRKDGTGGRVEWNGEHIRLYFHPSTRPEPSHAASALCSTRAPFYNLAERPGRVVRGLENTHAYTSVPLRGPNHPTQRLHFARLAPHSTIWQKDRGGW